MEASGPTPCSKQFGQVVQGLVYLSIFSAKAEVWG